MLGTLRRLARFALTWAAVCVVLAQVSSVARADDLADEADAQFQVGAERYEAGDFKLALVHFLTSNRLVPNKNVVFNIARTYEQLKEAPEAYRYYLVALDGETDQTTRTSIQSAVDRIKPSIAILDVTTDPPGATVYIDRKDLGPRGTTPRSLGFAPGSRTVFLELSGYEPMAIESVALAVGKTTQLSFKLVPILGTVKLEGAQKDAEIRVDSRTGPVAARVPGALLLSPGKHTLFVTATGSDPADIPIEVSANKTITIEPRLVTQQGTLVVSTDFREALVEVDGKPAGFTPTVLTLPVGAHKIRLTLAGFAAAERNVVVRSKQQVKLDVDLAGKEQVQAVSRTDESAEDAPSSLSIISGRELRAMGYPTIAEALRGTRGIYLTNDRVYTSIGIRGFARPGDYGNKVLILYDGLPYNDNILVQSFPGFEGRTDLEEVERIEVVRGPGSAFYGTGAFFGVINLVSHGPNQATRGEVTASTAEGAFRGRGLGYVNLGKDAAIWLATSGAHSDGRDFYFKEYDDPTNGTDGNARGLDSFTTMTHQARFFYKSLSGQAFYSQRQKHVPDAEYDTLFGDARHTQTDRRGAVEVKFEPHATKWLDSMTRAHGNIYVYEANFPYGEEDGGLAREDYLGVWAGLEQRLTFKPTEHIQIAVGGEGQRHFLARMKGTDNSGVYLPGDANGYWIGSAYTEGDFDFGKVRLAAGARLDVFSYALAAPIGDFTRFSINPRLAATFKPYAKGTLKVITGKAYRAPSVYELYYQSSVQVPSPNLRPEEVYSAEVEHTHHFTNSVSATAATYVNYVTGLVVGRGSSSEDDPLHLVNSPSPVLSVGAEVEAKRDFRDGWLLAGNVSVQRSQYLNDASDDLRELPNSPVLLASIRGAVPIFGDVLRLMSRITFETGRFDRDETSEDPAQTSTEPSVIWDAVFSGDVMQGQFRYNVGVYNIADQRAEAPVSGELRMLTVRQDGRSFLASGTVVF